MKKLIFILWSVICIMLSMTINDCKFLTVWQPRFGSTHQSCTKIAVEGHVWARNKFEQ